MKLTLVTLLSTAAAALAAPSLTARQLLGIPGCPAPADASCKELHDRCVGLPASWIKDPWSQRVCVAAATCFGVGNLLTSGACRQNIAPPNPRTLPGLSNTGYANFKTCSGCAISSQNYVDFIYGTIQTHWPSSINVVTAWWAPISSWTAFPSGNIPRNNFNDWLLYSSTPTTVKPVTSTTIHPSTSTSISTSTIHPTPIPTTSLHSSTSTTPTSTHTTSSTTPTTTHTTTSTTPTTTHTTTSTTPTTTHTTTSTTPTTTHTTTSTTPTTTHTTTSTTPTTTHTTTSTTPTTTHTSTSSTTSHTTTSTSQTTTSHTTTTTTTSTTPTSTANVVPGLQTSCKHDVGIGIDDGPYIWNQQIVDQASQAGAKLTFFVNGNNYDCIYADSNVANIRHAYEKGHTIASHTWFHTDITTITDEELGVELDQLEEALWKIIGVKPALFRPPYGNYNDRNINYLNSRGYTVITWDLDTEDWTGAAVEDSMITVQSELKDGTIILTHETVQTSADSLIPQMIDYVHSKNLNVLGLDQCLDTPAYQAVGSYGTRDNTWVC